MLWSQRPDARGRAAAQLRYASRKARAAMLDCLELRNIAGVVLSPFVYAVAWLRYLLPVDTAYAITTHRIFVVQGVDLDWLALEHCTEPQVVQRTGQIGSVLFPHDTDRTRDLHFDGIRDPARSAQLVRQTLGVPELTTWSLGTPRTQPRTLTGSVLKAPLDFEDGHYGPGTARMREIISAGRGIAWFPEREPANIAEGALAAGHLAALAAQFPGRDLATRPIVWVSGTLEDFDRLAPPTLPTEGWGDPWNGTPWGRLLLHLHEKTLARIESDAATLDLVKPPIWPLVRRVNLVADALYWPPPPREFQGEARWAMMEHVQYNYWRLLDWTLVWPPPDGGSPFHALYLLHLAGLYPLGFDEGGAFRVFYRTQRSSGIYPQAV